jgi:hypothetical protein
MIDSETQKNDVAHEHDVVEETWNSDFEKELCHTGSRYVLCGRSPFRANSPKKKVIKKKVIQVC